MGADGLPQRVWYGGGWPGVVLRTLLLPLEGLFRFGVGLRNHGYDRDWFRVRSAALPVVSVGNLTVGGTGKTPVTAWVARTLADSGHRPAILSRGYGQDELALHRRWNPDVPVFVAPRRIQAALAAAEAGATVGVVDDGFQHRGLARDLDVVLIAAEQPFPGALLPRGPYREPVRALARADLVVVTRKGASAARADMVANRIANVRPNLSLVRIALEPTGWTDLDGREAPPPGPETLAVCSVAEPGSFRDLVEQCTGGHAELMAFPDHHPYSSHDVERIIQQAAGRPVVTTEKDAAKLAMFAQELPEARVLRLAVRMEAGAKALLAALEGPLGRLPPPGQGGGR